MIEVRLRLLGQNKLDLVGLELTYCKWFYHCTISHFTHTILNTNTHMYKFATLSMSSPGTPVGGGVGVACITVVTDTDVSPIVAMDGSGSAVSISKIIV